eukprot:symbB.v1.2.004313.t2/scaffold188.1/size279614/2
MWQGSAEASQSQTRIPEEPAELPELRTPLHLTGKFANWRTDFAPSRLRRVALEKDTLRLAMCLRLTSQSFSFQVVSPSKGWNWRLYPRDAQPLRRARGCADVAASLTWQLLGGLPMSPKREDWWLEMQMLWQWPLETCDLATA